MHIRDKIDHFVVLMYENRSFDNLLGLLPHPGDGDRRFDGIPGGWALPSGDGKTHAAFPAEEDVRGKGPSHHHDSTLRQLVGPVHDWQAEFGDRPWKRVKQRWDAMLANGETNRGFIWDYEEFVDSKYASRVMGSWDESYVPAIWELALDYGISQRWFASLPGMTQPNRLFSMCGTSFGHVDNGKPLLQAPRESTVFHRLDEANIDWQFFASRKTLTGLLTEDVHGRRRGMRKFYERAREGKLPAFSYLEPSAFLPAESQHPGLGNGPDVLERGDDLLAKVYNALRANEDAWKRTLLVVTWDEHGGFADHVPPPRATPPTLPANAKNQGFDFSLLGVRVPGLVISPWVPRGHLDNTVRDHTCILRTVRELYGWSETFSDREASMPSLANMLADELPANDPRPRLVKFTEKNEAKLASATKLASAAKLVSTARPIAAKPTGANLTGANLTGANLTEDGAALDGEAMNLRLDGYQLDVANGMRHVAAQKGVDLGDLTDKPCDEWTVGELDAVSRALEPELGGSDED